MKYDLAPGEGVQGNKQVARVEFTPKTKRLLADRAGHQCSFPTCERRTTGPGPTAYTKSGSGTAAHIFSAAPGGPRGRGCLTDEEIRSPENGIWLCADHARLVDENAGSAYTPETLLSYKALQESRVTREVQGLYAPIGWIHSIRLLESPVFASGQDVTLSKRNLLIGANGAGKTALCEWIAGAFQSRFLDRWRTESSRPLRYVVSYLNPIPLRIEVSCTGADPPQFSVDGNTVPSPVVSLRVLFVRSPSLTRRPDGDDLDWIAESIGSQRDEILNLVNEIHGFPDARIRNLRFEFHQGRATLVCDVDGTVPNLALVALSGRETERVFIEFATAAARASGKYCPTLLILDACPLILFKGIGDVYRPHLLDPGNHFQTIMSLPNPRLDLDSKGWNGWEVIRTSATPPEALLSQNLRSAERARPGAPSPRPHQS